MRVIPGVVCGFQVLLSLILLGGLGCQHTGQSGLNPGKTSYQFYAADDSSEQNIKPKMNAEAGEVQGLSEGVTFRPARPIEPLLLPTYPDIPSAQRKRWVTVGVHLNIDREGRVTDITPSVICITTPHPRLADLQKAVEAAVKQWRFVPAEERQMEQVTDTQGRTWWRASQNEPVATTADVAFSFTASGEVKAE